MPLILNFVLPFALSILKSYIYSSSTKHDDMVLEATKEAVDYLAHQQNNTVPYSYANAFSVHTMRI